MGAGSLSQTRGAVEPDPRGILTEVSSPLWWWKKSLLCVESPPPTSQIGLRPIVWDTSCWMEDSQGEVKNSYYVSSTGLGINIHAGRAYPLEAASPAPGLNPICWTLPLTKKKPISFPRVEKISDLNKRFLELVVSKPLPVIPISECRTI